MTIEVIIRDDNGNELVHETRSRVAQPFQWNSPYEKPLEFIDSEGHYKLFRFVYQPTAVLVR